MTLEEWFNMKGKRFLELKLRGGEKLIRDPDYQMHDLDIKEVAEFFRLVGQLDGLLWSVWPSQPEEVQGFCNDAKKFFKDMEKEYKVIRNMPRGFA